MTFMAIGAVTKAIAGLIEKKMNKPPLMGASTTVKVTTLPPDDDRVDQENGINLFLFRVIESPFGKNDDWRGDRNSAGNKRPPLALTLQYLLTAYAKKSSGPARDDDITAQQLLGNALLILHEYPVLNDVHDGDFDADLDTQFAPELRDSFEKIKITMAPTTMEEFSKIWTGLSKAYRLSVAYEVSLVQIAPITPVRLPAPTVQVTRLDVTTLDAPQISSIQPATGPAGAMVKLAGKGFKRRGMTTRVLIGDLTMAETDLSKFTDNEIEFRIPEAPECGPDLPILVSRASRESAPVLYRIQPWIDAIQPQRGRIGIPITIPFEIQSSAMIGLEINGLATVFTPSADNKSIRAIVPMAITANGPQKVVFILNGNRSNARFFEVMPAIASVGMVTSGTPTKTTITITGERLAGKEVVLRYGKLLVNGGQNANATQAVFQVSRTVPANQLVSVLVDGRESNPLPPQLEGVEPAQAFAGDLILLSGKGLSGPAVQLLFGATPVVVGPQPFASQIRVAVPGGLAAGTIQVRAVINGISTNTIALEILP